MGEVTSCDSTVLESGITMNGGFEVVDVCLHETGAYIITVGGGTYDNEITWTLLDPEGNTVMEGQAGTYDNCDQGGGEQGGCEQGGRQQGGGEQGGGSGPDP